jgi:hypothetical protein
LLQIHLASHYPPSGRRVTFSRLAFLAAAASLLGAAGRPKAAAAEPLVFQLHGEYWSRREQIVPAVDPQVFVADKSVTTGGIGLENIEHIAGLRALRLDEPNASLFTADGVHLGFTSSRWLAATGSADVLNDSSGGALVVMRFQRLIAFGIYSVFKQVAGASRTVSVPLDGTGKKSTFRAGETGAASLRVLSPQPLEEKSTLKLVYHSDGRAHGLDPGPLGITTHEQLVAPLRGS